MKEKYIDEVYSYISENKNISTKSTVISPKIGIYRRNLQLYRRLHCRISMTPDFYLK